MIIKRIIAMLCFAAMLLIAGCGGRTNPAPNESPPTLEEITTITAFDVPADPRPYYERMQIRKPMPTASGEAMLYPLERYDCTCYGSGEWRYFCYLVNEKGETIVPVGTYRNAEYIYDNDGVEKYLLCERVREYNPDNPGEDVFGGEEGYFRNGAGYHVHHTDKREYDIVDFFGNVIYNFWGADAYAVKYGTYVVYGQENNSDSGGLTGNCTVYDVYNKKVLFNYPEPVYVPKPNVFISPKRRALEDGEDETDWSYKEDDIAYIIEYFLIDPKTGKAIKKLDKEIVESYRMYYIHQPEERYITVNEKMYEWDDGVHLLVSGNYYFFRTDTFIGYKDKSEQWVYRDLLEQSAVSGVGSDYRYE